MISKKKAIIYLLVGLVALIGVRIYSKFSSNKQATSAETPAEIKEILEQPAQDSNADERAAIENYTKQIAANQDDSSAYYQRGLLYQQLGQYKTAVADYSEAIRITPDADNAYYQRGFSQAMLGNFDQAIADYNEAIKIKPEKAEFFNARGLAYAEKNEYDLALKDYDQALSLEPKNGTVYFNRGTTYERKKMFAEAKADYDKSIELHADKDKFEVYYRRAILNLNNGDVNAALEDANKAVDLEQKNPKGYKLRASVYDKMGNTAAASSDESQAQNLEIESSLQKS